MNNKVVIGVDPGAQGSMAVIEPEGVRLIACDYEAYQETIGSLHLTSDAIFAVVEDVHAMPMNGCKGNFKLGWSLGRIQQILEGFRIPYQLVKPQTWQKEFGISNKDKSKQQSIEAAKRLFPKVNLKRTERCTKDHDGFADALLMAEWGRRHG